MAVEPRLVAYTLFLVAELFTGAVLCAGSGGERYRLVVSDTEYYCQAMLATQLNTLVTDKKVRQATCSAICL